jgi:WD40 repeat protein
VGLALSPSGELLACAVDPITSGTPHLDVWRVADGKRVVAIAMTPGAGPGSSWGADLAFSADARVLYGIENVNSASGASGKQFVTAWNVTDGSTLWRSELPPELYHGPSEGIPAPFSSLALSPDGSTLATGSVEVLLWHAADGTRVAGFQTPQQNVSAQVIAFSADGRSLATTYAINEVDKNAIVFGPTGAIAQSWPVEGGGCEGISFSPDGQRLAAACSDGLLEIWNPTNGDVVTRAKATTTLY